MERAFDTFQNQLAFASDCVRSDYFPDRFICPCCEETLIFAQGDIQSAHFKHRASAPECENRVAGMSHGPFSDIEAEPRDATLVALFTSIRGQRACAFVLRYRPGCEINSISVRMGERNIGYQLHGRSEIDVPVSVAAENFFILAEVSGHIVFRRTTKAFGEKPVLFRHTAAQAVRVPDNRLLHPGQYIACFAADKSIQFPLVCEAEPISCALNIKVVSFTIPANLNAQVISFCRDTFGMAVKAKDFNCAIIAPLAVTEDAPDIWTTSAEGNTEILVGSKTKVGTTTTLTVQFRDKARLFTYEQPITFTEMPLLLRFAMGKQKPLVRIGIGNPIQFVTELRFLEALPEPATTRFRFKFRDEKTGATFHLCRSSWALPEKLAGVRERLLAVDSIEFPACLKIDVVDSTQRVSVTRQTAGDVLTTVLRESPDAVTIDVHGYPPIVVLRQVAARIAKALSKPRDGKRPISSRRRQARAFSLGLGSRYSVFGLK